MWLLHLSPSPLGSCQILAGLPISPHLHPCHLVQATTTSHWGCCYSLVPSLTFPAAKELTFKFHLITHPLNIY